MSALRRVRRTSPGWISRRRAGRGLRRTSTRTGQLVRDEATRERIRLTIPGWEDVWSPASTGSRAPPGGRVVPMRAGTSSVPHYEDWRACRIVSSIVIRPARRLPAMRRGRDRTVVYPGLGGHERVLAGAVRPRPRVLQEWIGDLHGGERFVRAGDHPPGPANKGGRGGSTSLGVGRPARRDPTTGGQASPA